MPDQFRQPLRRRGISDHLKALRPSALAAASLAVATAAVGLGTWLAMASDGYYAGPVVRVSVAPAEPVITGTAEDRSGPADALDQVASLPPALLRPKRTSPPTRRWPSAPSPSCRASARWRRRRSRR